LFDGLKDVDVAAWIPPRVRIWLFPFFMASVAAFGVSLAIFANSLEGERARKLLHATGTVVKITTGSKPSCPIIQFTNVTGAVEQFKGNNCSKPSAISVGDQVSVSYVRGAADARISETEAFGHLGVAMFAALWLLVAAGATYSAFRQSKKLGSVKSDL
jgi:hypothetical protein